MDPKTILHSQNLANSMNAGVNSWLHNEIYLRHYLVQYRRLRGMGVRAQH